MQQILSYLNKLSKKQVFLLLLIVSFFLYANTFNNAMFWDDDDFILNNVYIKNFNYFSKFFSENIIAGSGLISNYWRPTLLTIFSIQWHLWQDWSTGYHFINFMFHTLDAYLVFLLIFKLFKNKTSSMFTSVIFLIHPLQTEAVAYANSLGDSLSVFFILLSLIFYLNYKKGRKTKYFYISLLMYIFSVTTKETAIIVPGLIFLINLVTLYDKKTLIWIKKALINTKEFLTLAFIYILSRATILNFQNTFNLYNENNEFTSNIAVRLFTFFRIITTYFSLIFYPNNLHMERSVNIAKNIFSLDVFIGMITVCTILFLIYKFRYKQKEISFGFAWFLISLVPTSNVLIPINGLLYEHWLYFPIIGISFALFYVLKLVSKNDVLKLAFFITFVIYFLFFSYRTIKRNNEWENPISFYKQTLQYNPNSYRLINNLGMEYADIKDFDNAIKQYKKAIEIDPNNPVAIHNLANAYKETNSKNEAIKLYRKAILKDKKFIFSYTALAQLYINSNDIENAIVVLEEYINKVEPNQQILLTLAQLSYKNKNLDKTLYYLETVVKLNPSNQQLKQQLMQVRNEKINQELLSK